MRNGWVEIGSALPTHSIGSARRFLREAVGLHWGR
jgi:hypothetical protein